MLPQQTAQKKTGRRNNTDVRQLVAPDCIVESANPKQVAIFCAGERREEALNLRFPVGRLAFRHFAAAVGEFRRTVGPEALDIVDRCIEDSESVLQKSVDLFCFPGAHPGRDASFQ